MNNDLPLVSIIMPAYNSKDYISNSVKSVLMQTYRNFELLIIDDCSTDGTMKEIENLSDQRVKIIKNEKNMGAAFSRNTGIKYAKGKYIAFLDSDDQWSVTKLEKQVAFMRDNNYYFSYTKYQENRLLKNEILIISGPKKITKYKLNKADWIGCLTAMYDVEHIGKISIPLLKSRNDYAMWLKIIEKCDCYLLDETLAYYNHRSGTISSKSLFNKLKATQLLFKTVQNKNGFVAWMKAFRCAVWSILKKIKFEKKIKK